MSRNFKDKQIERVKNDLFVFFGKYYITTSEFAKFMGVSQNAATGMLRKVPCINKNPENPKTQRIYNINNVSEFIIDNTKIA